MKNLLRCALFIMLAICIIMCVLYFCVFNNGISQNSDDWSNFGCYMGSVTGLLAFAGVLYSIQLSNKIHTEDSERDTFFKLLDLHTNKMSSVEFNGKKGAEAFKELADKANKSLMLQYIYQYVIDECSELDKTKLKDLHQNNSSLFNVLEFVYQILFPDSLCITPFEQNIDYAYFNYQKMVKHIKKNGYELRETEKCKNIEKIILCLNKYIEGVSVKNRLNNIQAVADFIYKEYGHILGHYFRKMDTIDRFSDKKNYKELFRAQLSRYELALGLFNAVSSNSSTRMIHLLKDFKIFKDTYPNDITVLKVLMDKGVSNDDTNQDKMLTITNEVLNEWKP